MRLSVIARAGGRGPVCSTIVAESVNTNPVVIRRLMRDLEKAELVSSATGRAGGFTLNREPGEHHARRHLSRGRGRKHLPHAQDRPRSRVARSDARSSISSRHPFNRLRTRLRVSLAKTTLSDIAAQIA